MSGCAAARYYLTSTDSRGGFKNFDELTDDEALEAVALIHNVRVESGEEAIAKNVAIGEFNKALEKRNSLKIKDSGILQLEYEKTDISKWSDSELLRMFKFLQYGSSRSGLREGPELTNQGKGLLVISRTAKGAIAKEGRRRDNLRGMWQIFGQALLVALSVVVSII